MPSAVPSLDKCNLGCISLFQGRHFHRQRTSPTFEEVRLIKNDAGFVNLLNAFPLSLVSLKNPACNEKLPRNSRNFAAGLLPRYLHDSVRERGQRLSDVGPIVTNEECRAVASWTREGRDWRKMSRDGREQGGMDVTVADAANAKLS